MMQHAALYGPNGAIAQVVSGSAAVIEATARATCLAVLLIDNETDATGKRVVAGKLEPVL